MTKMIAIGALLAVICLASCGSSVENKNMTTQNNTMTKEDNIAMLQMISTLMSKAPTDMPIDDKLMNHSNINVNVFVINNVSLNVITIMNMTPPGTTA